MGVCWIPSEGYLAVFQSLAPFSPLFSRPSRLLRAASVSRWMLSSKTQ